jgi:hypothetical protein
LCSMSSARNPGTYNIKITVNGWWAELSAAIDKARLTQRVPLGVQSALDEVQLGLSKEVATKSATIQVVVVEDGDADEEDEEDAPDPPEPPETGVRQVFLIFEARDQSPEDFQLRMKLRVSPYCRMCRGFASPLPRSGGGRALGPGRGLFR